MACNQVPEFGTAFDVSNREALLAALAFVIKQEWPWLKTIRRQSIEEEDIARIGLPAVVIEENQTSYVFENRHAVGEMRVEVVVTFDLIMEARRNKSNPFTDVSTVREMMVSQLLRILQNNAELICQLPGEDEPCRHAVDAFNAATVNYIPEAPPLARATVTVAMLTSENFLEAQRVTFEQLVVGVGPAAASPSEPEPDCLAANIELDTNT